MLKTFCRSVRTHMPLFTEWGIATKEKYNVQKRPIRAIEYMEVSELIQKLRGKATRMSETATSQECEERKVRLKEIQ